MNGDKYSRHIELRCPTCGGSQFEHDDDIDNDHANVRCTGCDREMTKEELIQENAETIDEHAQEVGQEVMKELEKKMKSDMKKAFKGDKQVKIK